MKIISSIISIIMSILSLLFPSEEKPEFLTVEIDGKTYKNCFIDENLKLCQSYNFYTEEPVFTEEVEGAFGGYINNYYDLGNGWIYKNESTSLSVDFSQKIFCPEEDWEKLKAHYADAENYKYYSCSMKFLDEGDFNRYKLENVDSEKFDEIIDTAEEISKGKFNYKDYKTFPFWNYTMGAFRKESNDGIFYSQSETLLIKNKKVYYFSAINGTSGQFYAVAMPEEANDYAVELFRQADVI